MTVIERKTFLKHKIDNADEEMLDEIENLFNNEKIYILNDEQLLRVEVARAEYLRGETLSEEEVEKMTEEWFAQQEK